VSTASPQTEPLQPPAQHDDEALDVVVCGSFRKERRQLEADIEELTRAGCAILSPADTDFVEEREGFVFARHELGSTPEEIERVHLGAIHRANFVWLHAPNGYLGPSAAFEVGMASAAGVPVFSRRQPVDVALKSFVRPSASPTIAAAACRRETVHAPGTPLASLQTYYRRVAQERGWDAESPTECMLLLTEEVGELARAVRIATGLARDASRREADVAEELADVQLYIIHLANTLSLDLASAVTIKEAHNARRQLLREVATA
jgi:NTP pyrophosphatase (non-canonical NTP hydrolase)